jgi:anti-sigma factor RsiW
MNAADGEDRWTALLSSYLDGELTPGERLDVEAHLADCPRCRALLEEFRALVDEAPALRVDGEPAADLWPGIRERLRPRSSRRRGLRALVPGTWPERSAWLRPAMAAAALVLVVAAALVLLSRGEPSPSPARRASNEGSAAPAVAPLPARPLEASREYYDTLARLERAARVRLARDPRVVEVIEENLEVLDMAIAQYTDALAEQPGDPGLTARLEAARQRKIDVLRQAVDLAAGAGN